LEISKQFAIATSNDNLLVFLFSNKQVTTAYYFSDNQPSMQNHIMLPIHFILTLFSLLTPDTEKPWSKT